ncbi:MAG: EamA family transporter RarD [Bdellovibrionales bacterium]|nr:EamA family transporter RarD [Bdellovibrionales bacterium]
MTVTTPAQAARLVFALYVFWGLLPIYWAYVPDLRPMEILFFRMITAIPIVLVLHRFFFKRGLVEILRFIKENFFWIALTATLIAVNWTLFIYAVVVNRVTEASLGSFLNPLFNVALGAAFFQDRLSRMQWVSVAIAASGVFWMVFQMGQVPLVGLGLGGSFSVYSALRKKRNWDPWLATASEFSLLTVGVILLALGGWIPVAMPVLPRTGILLCFAGAITILPLWLFFVSMTQLTLSSLGFLQYISPTLVFLIGISVFHESVSMMELIGYVLVWVALGLFSLDLYQDLRRKRRLTSVKAQGR